MKKSLLFALCALLLPIVANAYNFSVDGIYYNKNSDGTSVTVTYKTTSDRGYSGSVAIPSQVTYNNNTYDVTSIGGATFSGCSGLTSVTIPNSVTSIGSSAFEGCTGLTSITIPNSVTSIEYHAFYRCSGLTSVTIPNSVTSIGSSAFEGCTGLTSVTIPNSVTSISGSAFYGCSGLTSVIIGNNVTSIGSSAFSGCSGLTSVIIGNNVTSIGSSAFSGCSGLTSVTLNANDIVSKTYSSRSNLETIFGSQVKEYVLGDDLKGIGSYAFFGCSGLTSISIPNSVTSIGDCAFYDCSSLTSVTIPNSVTSIGERAFYDCSSLTSVTIPNSVTSIGERAFYNCSGLTSLKVEEGNPKYDSRNNCNAILESSTNTLIAGCKTTTIPNGVTSIGYEAFFNCSGLTSVTIPNSVTSIGNSAFSGCSGLTSVTIPNSVTSIGSYAFYNCSSLTSVTIPNSVTSIGSSAFDGCSGLTSVTIPNSVTSIGQSAFSGCSGLTSVTIPNNVKSIGNYAFSDCSGLTSVTLNANDIVSNTYTSYGSNLGTIFGTQVKEYILGDDVKGIGNYAFEGCSGLTSVTIPNSVTSIGNCAFYHCSTLTSVTIPNSVTSIGNYAFESCSGLTSIKVNTGNPVYDSRYNCNAIIETKTNTLIQGCKNTIIPEGVTSIGEDAFVSCTGLTSINIPSSVTSISDEAFDGCTGLQAVYCDAINIPTTGKNVFRNIASATLYVPESMVSKYRYKTPWSDFSTISPFPYFNVDGIYYNIYTTGTNVSVTYNPTSPSGYLSLVEIPSTVKYNDKQYIVNRIGTSAFSGCSELTSVKVPESVISIGDYAFSDCSSLTSITIPNSVTSIGSYAFTGCPLQTIINRGNKDVKKDTFYDRVYLHTQLYVPEGTVWDYIFNTGWGEFHNIREFANNADNIRNNAVYLIADHSGRNFPVYDRATKSLKNVAYTLNLDDNDAGACWRIVKDGSDTYLYNIGAGMYAAYDVENKLSLSIAPSAVDIKVTKEGTMINGKPAMLVVNKSVTPDPTYITGDANGNGVVEIGDVTSVLTLMATPDAIGYDKKAADANGNGEIEIGDVTTILTIMAGN